MIRVFKHHSSNAVLPRGLLGRAFPFRDLLILPQMIRAIFWSEGAR